MIMTKYWGTLAALGLIAVVVSPQVGATPPSTKSTQAVAVGTSTNADDDVPLPPVVQIRGLVRDIACAVQKPKAEARDFNLQCAEACALAGSPLIVQTDDGKLYIPISNTIPDTDQRRKLLPFVGKYVQLSGRVYVRQGTRAIALDSIKELPDVKLKTQ